MNGQEQKRVVTYYGERVELGTTKKPVHKFPGLGS